eukprot:jgi/Mesen1/10637/ME000894S10201
MAVMIADGSTGPSIDRVNNHLQEQYDTQASLRHMQVAQAAVAGWEKAASEAAALKLQLDQVVQQKEAADKKCARLDGALKECMRELRRAREEQAKRIQDAVADRAKEWEDGQKEVLKQLEESQQMLERSNAKAAASNKELKEQLREATSEMEAMAVVLEDRSLIIKDLEQKIQELELQVHLMQEEKMDVEKSLTRKEGEEREALVDALTTNSGNAPDVTNESFEAVLNELAEANNKVLELTSLLEKAKQDAAGLDAELLIVEDLVSQLAKEVAQKEGYQVEMETLRKANDHLLIEKSNWTEDGLHLRLQLSAAEQIVAELQEEFSEREDMQRELTAARARVAELSNELDKWRYETADLAADLTWARNRVVELCTC